MALAMGRRASETFSKPILFPQTLNGLTEDVILCAALTLILGLSQVKGIQSGCQSTQCRDSIHLA